MCAGLGVGLGWAGHWVGLGWASGWLVRWVELGWLGRWAGLWSHGLQKLCTVWGRVLHGLAKRLHGLGQNPARFKSFKYVLFSY